MTPTAIPAHGHPSIHAWLLLSARRLRAWARRCLSVAIVVIGSQATGAAQVLVDPLPGPKTEKANNNQVDPKQENPEEGDPVVMKTGDFTIRKVDLSIPGRTTNFALIRTYRNTTAIQSALGPNWDFNWNKKIVLQMRRVQVPIYHGPVGEGWHAFDDQQPTEDDYLTAIVPEGAYYYDGETRIDRFGVISSGWTTPNGYFAALLSHGGGIVYSGSTPHYQTPDWFELRNAEGTVFTFGLKDNSAGHPGPTYHLTRVDDRRGDRFLLDYEVMSGAGSQPHYRLKSVFETLGRRVDFLYDTYGRLSTVRDFAQREVIYTYDTSGCLTEARSPIVTGPGTNFPSGKTARYVYSPPITTNGPRNLLETIAPREVAAASGGSNGTPFLVNTYDNSQRVVKQVQGGAVTVDGVTVQAGGTTLFRYGNTTINHGWFTETSRTLHVSPNGNVSLFVFNQEGNERVELLFTGRLDPTGIADTATIDGMVEVTLGPTPDLVSGRIRSENFAAPTYVPPLRPTVDPSAFVTVRDFNVHGQIVLERGPGQETVHTYDGSLVDVFARRNLVRTERRAVPADGSGPLITAYVYEPVYNELRAVFDPRANDPGYVPQNGGSWSPSRYMTLHLFDYQEGDALTAAGSLAALASKWGIELAQSQLFTTMAGWWPSLPIQPINHGSSCQLGDLNGDGTTTQTHGNEVQTRYPTPALLSAPTSPGETYTPGAPITASYTWNDFSLLTSVTDPEGGRVSYEYFSEKSPNGTDTSSDPAPTLPPLTVTLDPVTGAAGGGFKQSATLPEPVGNEIVLHYGHDLLGRRTSTQDGRGQTTQTTFDESDQLVRMVSPRSYTTTLFHDANGNLIRREAERWEPVIDALGHPAGESVVGMEITEIVYDLLDQAVEERVRIDSQTVSTRRVRYDREGNRVLILLPESIHDPLNLVSVVIDERGLDWKTTRGGIVSEFAAQPGNHDVPETPVTSLLTSTITKDYSLLGNPTRVEDGEGHVTQYTYDGLGRSVRSDEPLPGNYAQYVYDRLGNVLLSSIHGDRGDGTQGLLAHSRQKYDELGRLYQVEDALFAVGSSQTVPDTGALSPGDGYVTRRNVYDRKNRIVKVVDDNAHATDYAWDKLDRLVRTTDAGGNEHRNFYDKAGNVLRVEELEKSSDGTWSQLSTSWSFYDQQNRLVAVCDQAGRTQRRAYDSQDRVCFFSDAEGPGGGTLAGLDLLGDHAGVGGLPGLAINDHGNTVTFAHDLGGRNLASTAVMRAGGTGAGAKDPTQAGDGIVKRSRTYDLNGRVLSETDDRQGTTSYEYDALNRRKTTRHPDSTSETSLYDRNDMPKYGVDAMGNQFVRMHDARSRLRTVDITRGPGVVGSTRQEYEYDGVDRCVRSVDNNDPADSADDAVVQVAFDSLGRVIEQRQTVLSWSHQALRSHDGVGNLKDLVYPNGRVMTHQYSATDKLLLVREGAVELGRFSWVGLERVTSRKLNGGEVELLRGYDSARRVTSHQQLDDLGQLQAGFAYDYTRTDRKRYEVRTHAGTEGNVWGYDSLRRLVLEKRDVSDASAEATSAGSGGRIGMLVSYQLDGVGNMSSVVENGTVYTNPVNILNQYTSFKGRPVAHDLAGNRTAYLSKTAAYDAFNRLVTVHSQGNLVATYKYGADDERLAKVQSGGSGTLFVYAQGDLLEERSLSDGSLTRQHVHGVDGEELLQVRDFGAGAPVDTLILTDARGSTVGMADSQGAVQMRVKYTAYGRPTFCAPDGTVLPPAQTPAGDLRLFAGAYYDAETGYYYMRRRYYDPLQGRFLSRDPLGTWLASANLGNAYTFAASAPQDVEDPDGLWPKKMHGATTSEFIKQKTGSDSLAKIASKANTGMDDLARQTPGCAHEHGMSRKRYFWDSESQAQINDRYARRSEGFIDKHLDRSADALLNGDVEKAMKEFGKAAHTAQDKTSPEHRDANGDPIPWGCGPVEAYEHGKAEGAHPEAQQRAACQEALKQTWDQLNEKIGGKIYEAMGKDLADSVIDQDTVKKCYEDAAKELDAAGRLAQTDKDNKAGREDIMNLVNERARQKHMDELRERAKTDPAAKEELDRRQGVGDKGDCEHHGSVSRRRNANKCKNDDGS